MKYPAFAHGSMVNIKKAIVEGRIKYPTYIWCTDLDVYCFLNKDGELEQCGIPQLVGTIQNKIILSALEDGLYEVKGQHKITDDHPTTFDSTSFILVVVQTIGGVKKVSRIVSDELIRYEIGDDLTVTEDAYVTESYLKEHGYADEEYIDEKIAILKAELEDEIEELVAPVVEPMVRSIIDEEIQPEDDENIRELFD